MTILNLQVGQGLGDGSEAGTGVMTTNSVSQTVTSANAWFAFIFETVAIPKGAIILTAVLQLYFVSTGADSPAVNIHAEASDNAALLTTTVDDISSRPRTTSFTNWTGADIGTTYKSSPDLAPIIQEVVDRAGWAENNNLAIILDCQTGVNMGIRMFEQGTGHSAKLDIEYILPKLMSGRIIQSPRPIRHLRI